MDQLPPIIGFAALLSAIMLGALLILIFRKLAEDNLQRWLADNRLRPIERQRRNFKQSPFSYLSTSRDDRFFRIIVMTETDERKSGWVRASGKFSGLGERVTVIWDDQPGAQSSRDQITPK